MKTEKKFIIVKKNYRNISDAEVPKMVIEIYVFSVKYYVNFIWLFF